MRESCRPQYREKVPVLCIYERTVREPTGTKRILDGVMVEVEFSDQIKTAFERRMWEMVNSGRHVGVRPLEWKLVSYLTPDGRKNF